MHWIFKKELVKFNFDKFKSHVQLPLLKDDYVYFSSRDFAGRSHINRIKDSNFEIILSPKEDFDCLGCMPSCFVDDCIFYTGWEHGNPYAQNICLHDSGKRFKVLTCKQDDSFLVNSACVLKADGIYKMWYVSCVDWVGKKPLYNINYAESKTLYEWKIVKKNCLTKLSLFESPSRPCVNYINGKYFMYFSSINLEVDFNYKLNFALSNDGINWKREKCDIDYNNQLMLCYPWVDGKIMLINGNKYGETSIFLYEKQE
jgi:hypothetical protein